MQKQSKPNIVSSNRDLNTDTDFFSRGENHRCLVSPHPDLRERIKRDFANIRESAPRHLRDKLRAKWPLPVGMCDGTIYPGNHFPLGTPARVVMSAAADRAPLSGDVRVVVVLVEFSDKSMTQTKQHFENLFFSTGILTNGSVKEYFADVTNDTVNIIGDVVGPYTLPQTIVEYANGESGTGTALPNARTMARDAAVNANPDVDFGPYDNDGDGFVDAFVVIHAGSGAEQTGNPDDIWSHKWVLDGGEFDADDTKIYAYLTVPEDAKIGVCSHELGHLLFGFPDLYDTDESGEGVGNWCLMGGGSWLGGGDVPAHPSAWCKANQGWVNVINKTSNGNETIIDVKTSKQVYRLWKDGGSGSEYFLVENRQKSGYDQHLPGEGLLIWHIDDDVSSNSNENHPKVALEQADGSRNLENGDNRGDAGDPWPGSANNVSFNNTSTPNSKSYGNMNTCVGVTNISSPGPSMTAHLAVKCTAKSILKDWKDSRKETEKLRDKQLSDKFRDKLFGDKTWDKRPEKPEIDKHSSLDKGFQDNKFRDKLVDGRGFDFEFRTPQNLNEISNLEARVSALEAKVGGVEPFIDESMRPDLRTSALASEDDVDQLDVKMKKGAAQAKRHFDTKPRY